MRERPDARAVRDRGVGDDAVVEHRHAIADPRVDDADAAVNLAVRPDGRPSLERHPGADDRVRAHLDGGVDVGRRRIFDRHAGRHQFVVLLLSHDSAHFRQLAPAVDAADFVGVRHRHGFDAETPLAVHRDQVGQVVLLLRILRRDGAHRVEEPVEREGINAGIDLADVPFRRAGVAFLNNTCNLLAGSDDAAVAAGTVDPRGQHCRRGARGRVVIQQPLQRFRREHRHIAGEQHERSGLAAKRRFGHKQRVCGPPLWFLDHKREAWVARQRRFQQFRLGTHDDGRRLRLERRRGRQDVVDHGEAGDTVQHFRPCR